MKIISKTDALGTLTIGNVDVALFHNDTDSAITFNFTTNGKATCTAIGDDLIITMMLGGECSITQAAGGSFTVVPGGSLQLRKSVAVGAYTPIIEQEFGDSVWMKQIATNGNVLIDRVLNYWMQATQLAGLGLTTVAGITAAATVKVDKDSVNEIASSIDVGTVNVVG